MEKQLKLAAREAKEKETGRKSRRKKPEPPPDGPRPADQDNFTDPESRIMKDGESFEQCINVQPAVEVETMLLVDQYVCQAPNDKQQLEPAMDCISPAVAEISHALADSGSYSEKAVCAVESKGAGPTVYAAMKRPPHERRIEDLEEHADPPPDASMAEQAEYSEHTEGESFRDNLFIFRVCCEFRGSQCGF